MEKSKVDVIAWRVFTVVNGDRVEVPVSIYRPHQDGSEFRCAYTIEWPDGVQHGYGLGVDTLQALTSALQRAGADIMHSAYAKSGRLVWLEPGMGYGLPLPDFT